MLLKFLKFETFEINEALSKKNAINFFLMKFEVTADYIWPILVGTRKEVNRAQTGKGYLASKKCRRICQNGFSTIAKSFTSLHAHSSSPFDQMWLCRLLSVNYWNSLEQRARQNGWEFRKAPDHPNDPMPRRILQSSLPSPWGLHRRTLTSSSIDFHGETMPWYEL